MTFSHEEIQKLTERRDKLEAEWAKVQKACLAWKLSNRQAKEYLRHGFLRRLATIVRCIQNTFVICPLEQDRKLSHEEEVDLRIQLQSHVSNVSGCLDNLAWVWVYEKSVTEEDGKAISRIEVGLTKKCKSVRRSLRPDFSKYLKEQASWLDELERLRQALTHRIPLYVPPCALTAKEAESWKTLDAQMWAAWGQGKLDDVHRLEAERDALGRFLPVMTHSFEERAPVMRFHPKMLLDFEIITELADKLYSSFGIKE